MAEPNELEELENDSKKSKKEERKEKKEKKKKEKQKDKENDVAQEDDMSIQDYYTIVKENDEYKLNINNYIGKEEVNKTKKQNGVEIYIAERKN